MYIVQTAKCLPGLSRNEARQKTQRLGSTYSNFWLIVFVVILISFSSIRSLSWSCYMLWHESCWTFDSSCLESWFLSVPFKITIKFSTNFIGCHLPTSVPHLITQIHNKLHDFFIRQWRIYGLAYITERIFHGCIGCIVNKLTGDNCLSSDGVVLIGLCNIKLWRL